MENTCYDSTSSNQKTMDHLYCHPNETWHNSNNNNSNNNNKKYNKKTNLLDKTNAIRSNGINNSYELLTKENKQLKSMLLLHLDLIQQQAEKLSIQERELATRNDESTALRLCIEQLETQVAELQKQKQIKCAAMERSSVPPPPLAKIKCVHDNLKATLTTTTTTTTATTKAIAINTITPFGIATIQPLINLPATNTPKKDDNIILAEIKQTNILDDVEVKSVNATVKERLLNVVESTTNNNNNNNDNSKNNKIEILNNKLIRKPQVSNSIDNKDKCEKVNALTEINNKLDEFKVNKINTQKICELIKENQTIIENRTEEISNVKELNEEEKPLVKSRTQQENNNNNNNTNNNHLNNNNNSNNVNVNNNASMSSVPSSPCSSPVRIPTTTPNHKKKRRLWYTPAPDLVNVDDEDDGSLECFEFTSDIETASRSTSSITPSNFFEKLDNIGSSENSIDGAGQKSDSKSSSASSMHSCLSTFNSLTCNIRLNSDGLIYCISKSPYHSRTWLEEELDGELEEDEARALRALEPKLEIPKWTEHELIPCYSIEGTEDLSDDTFFKRHAKQEMDEKRRKKWDVQQIREQRRIEKLRRRHCKDELIQGPVIQSFFPLPEDLETICYMDTLPLQAFGESIPKIPNNSEGFGLPWLIDTENTTRTMESPKQWKNSVLKMEKITQESSSVNDQTYENVKQKCFKVENAEEHALEEDQADAKSLSLKEDTNTTEDKEQSQALKTSSIIIGSEEESTELSKKDLGINSNLVCKTSRSSSSSSMSSSSSSSSTSTPTKMKETDELESDVNTTAAVLAKDLDSNVNITTTTATIAMTTTTTTITATTTSTLLPFISKSCYTPMVMLAQHTRSCSSRTQMRKRLKYSSYIFITKRKRQQSMSTTTNMTNMLSLNAANAKINTTMKCSNNNLSVTQEASNETQIEAKILETTNDTQSN